MQPSGFSQCGGAEASPCDPPPEMPRRQRGGPLGAAEWPGSPVVHLSRRRPPVVCGLWGVWHLVFSEGTKNQV